MKRHRDLNANTDMKTVRERHARGHAMVVAVPEQYSESNALLRRLPTMNIFQLARAVPRRKPRLARLMRLEKDWRQQHGMEPLPAPLVRSMQEELGVLRAIEQELVRRRIH